MPTAVNRFCARIVLLVLTKFAVVRGMASVHKQPALGRVNKPILTANPSPSCVALKNKGSFSLIDIAVGTPEQIFSIVADTGSDNVIIPSCMCQENHRCFKGDRCFTGHNKSSTFAIDDGADGPMLLDIEFGSGPIRVAVSSDVVRVGNVQIAMDNGVFLMTDHNLNFGGSFEGILGLGIPSSLRPPAQEWEDAEAEEFVFEYDLDGSDDLDGLDEAFQGVMEGMSGAEPQVSEFGHVAKTIKSHGSSNDSATVTDGEDSSGLISIVHAPSSITSMDQKTRSADPNLLDQPGFLESAGVNRFSMCFNDEADGALRLNPPPAASTLKAVGGHHWAVELHGVSVGGNSTALDFCASSSPLSGDKTPCAAIPDSGTTSIMGHPMHIEMLFESICDGWERCRQNHTALVRAASAASAAAAAEYGFDPFSLTPFSKSEVFQFLIYDCDSWLSESDDGLNELPSINFNIGSANGTKQVLEMSAWSYVLESLEGAPQSFQSRSREMIPMFTSVGAGDNATHTENPKLVRQCEPAFDSMDFVTPNHGPVWIFGTPFFYMFDVGYDLQASPPGVSFTSLAEVGCGTCAADSNAALVSESRNVREIWDSHRQPRRAGPKRLPSIDASKPL